MNLIHPDEAPATVLDFAPLVASQAPGLTVVRARAHNFLVQWVESAASSGDLAVASADEMMVLVADGGVAARCGDARCEAGASSAMILRPGLWQLAVAPVSRLAVLSSLREPSGAGAGGTAMDPAADAAPDAALGASLDVARHGADSAADSAARSAINASDYLQRDPRLVGVGRPYRRDWGGAQAQVLRMADVRASPDRPRLKMLQTATMSINWVDYDGPRDRSALSPHAHADFEQGSLAMAGAFVHHLRAEWGADADRWKQDAHPRVGSPSLMVVPAQTIHTSEGVGPGRHLLIDIFSPPRADFIAHGWVFNAGDYAAPEAP
jgi:hypothetical protein